MLNRFNKIVIKNGSVWKNLPKEMFLSNDINEF